MSNEIEIELNEDLEVEEPKKYNVFLLNDDYSTMDFVIDVLVKVFRKIKLKQSNNVRIFTTTKKVFVEFIVLRLFLQKLHK